MDSGKKKTYILVYDGNYERQRRVAMTEEQLRAIEYINGEFLNYDIDIMPETGDLVVL